jgi:DNA polymerase elongation subunit (family B)
VISLDLETIIRKQRDFLTNEPIIAVSVSYFKDSINTELFVAKNESIEEEENILIKSGNLISSLEPAIIIGYNHTGYDIPLLQMKLKSHSIFSQLYKFKYYLATSYIVDMMYVVADYLYSYDGDYRLRKLSEVVMHEAFSDLNLDRKKNLVIKEGRGVGEVIEDLWKSGSDDFIDYIRGDTRDILEIFFRLFPVEKSSQDGTL